MGWDANGAIVFNDVVCSDNAADFEGGCFYGVGRALINDGTVMTDNSGGSGGGSICERKQRAIGIP